MTPYAIIFIIFQFITRITLLARSMAEVHLSGTDIANIMLRGLWFDIGTCAFVMLPLALIHLLPVRRRISHTALRFTLIYILLFTAVAEHLFWSEFSARFNFIAVDYLVYTQEVVGNITESYPLAAILSGIAIAAGLLTFLSLKIAPPKSSATRFHQRAGTFAALCVIAAGFYAASDIEQAQFTDNVEADELAANGIYTLFYAYVHNEISYDHFYAMRTKDKAHGMAKTLLMEEDMSAVIPDNPEGVTRAVHHTGPERHKNVMLVVMESMSADYMGVFGNKDGLTPNLDRLAKEGLLFSQNYATGTRTVRGLEAVTLSIPPTPGQSIIRRPDNGNLFSVGFVFRDRGYDTRFLYGGYGYFDNMNTFFAGNGFDVVDRTSMTPEEIHFANVWGVADDDMFARAIREADKSYADGKPFLHLIMTTSNHRPYTYPEGRIDIAPKTSRYGGVKYADYSIGKLIEWAKDKPWFNDTVFVFVADHTAGASGKAELDPHKYHIPLIYYSPGFIAPSSYAKISSQIDVAPILLGLLNFSYNSKFYGEDLLHDDDEIPHAFISNFQKVALIKEDTLTVLGPKQRVESFGWPGVERLIPRNTALEDDAVAYYQSASWWRETYQRVPTRLRD